MKRTVALGAWLLMLVGVVAEGASVERARQLAFSGQRGEALAELERRLAESPSDYDARTFYGTVLSWEGRREEARRELQRVLNDRPRNSDALVALGHLELWDRNHDLALTLADQALVVAPARIDAQLLCANALMRLDRRAEAMTVVDRVLEIDPDNETAISLRRALRGAPTNSVSVIYDHTRFDDARRDWNEAGLSWGHRWPRVSMIATARHAERFSTDDRQIELEAYPSIRRGTYAYLALALGQEHTLFPRWRVGADLYQSLGRGYEAALGYRHLEFASGTDIYIASLTRYIRNWMLTGRVFHIPRATGSSMSYHALARLYAGNGRSYAGLRLSKGFRSEEVRSLNDVEVFDSQGVGLETLISGRLPLDLTLRAGYHREERPFDRTVGQTSMSATISYRY